MRLTKAIKEQIVEAALDHKFKALITEAKNNLTAAAEALYDARLLSYHNLTRQQLLNQVKVVKTEVAKLPDGCRGWSVVEYESFVMIERTRIDLIDHLPDFDGIRKSVEGLPAEETAAQALKALNELNESRTKLQTEMEGALEPFTTDTRLIKDWPEIERFIPKSVTTAGVPMVQVGKINNQLGI